MGFMDDLVRQASMGHEHEDEDAVCISGNDLEELVKSFIHLDLKPGDKVQWKDSAHKDAKFPALHVTAEVFRTFPVKHNNNEAGSNHFLDECDFSIILVIHGKINEFAYDSRRFKLV